ncbi:MAG: hypothetical protein OWU32_01325 [Firmicutes bacterium]|nr:hypothetical protein [Bacillota bacterium]
MTRTLRTWLAMTSTLAVTLGVAVTPAFAQGPPANVAQTQQSPSWTALPDLSALNGLALGPMTTDSSGNLYVAFNASAQVYGSGVGGNYGIAEFDVASQSWTVTPFPSSVVPSPPEEMTYGNGSVYFMSDNGSDVFRWTGGQLTTMSGPTGGGFIPLPNYNQTIFFDPTTSTLFGVYQPSPNYTTSNTLDYFDSSTSTWLPVANSPAAVLSVTSVNGILYVLTEAGELFSVTGATTKTPIWTDLGQFDPSGTGDQLQDGLITSAGQNLVIADDSGVWLGTPAAGGRFTWSLAQTQGQTSPMAPINSIGSIDGQVFALATSEGPNMLYQGVGNTWSLDAQPPSSGVPDEFPDIWDWIDQTPSALFADTNDGMVYEWATPSTLTPGGMPELPFAAIAPVALAGAVVAGRMRKRRHTQ